MPTEKFSNNPVTTLNGSIDGVVTSLVVTSAVLFPTLPQFRIRIEDEILLVTGVSGTTFTVVRGSEGSSNVPHSNGVEVVHILTAGSISQLGSDLLAVIPTFATARLVDGNQTVLNVQGKSTFHDGFQGVFDRQPVGSYVDDDTDVLVAGSFAYVRRVMPGSVGVILSDGTNKTSTGNRATRGAFVRGAIEYAPKDVSYLPKYLSTQRLVSLLGSKLVSLYYPDDATTDGLGVTGIPSVGVTADALVERHTTSDRFQKVRINGRYILRSTVNSKKALAKATGTTVGFIIWAKPAVVLHPPDYGVAVASQTDGLGGLSLMQVFDDATGLWYNAVNFSAGANGTTNPNIFSGYNVYYVSSGSSTGMCIGSITTATRDFIGDIGIVLQLNAALTADEQLEVARIIREYYGAQRLIPCIFDGNSLTAAGNWVEGILAASLNPVAQRLNIAVSGQTGATLLSLQADNTAMLDGGETRRIYVVWEGTNDIGGGATGAQAAANLFAACDAMRAKGYANVLANVLANNASTWDSTKQSYRTTCNATLLAGWRAHADRFVDLTSDSRLTNPNDTTYFDVDKLHLNATGYPIAGALVGVQVASLIADMI
jgi:lysophospholipase L1-like esterase